MAEQKNAEIVQLFNQFLETEYRKYCENYENHLNLRKPQQEELLELEEEETATPKKLKNQKKLCNSFVKPILQTLCAKLPVFSSQPNPKALHKSAELYEFYMHLLSGSNTQLQKLALDCIMAYKSKALLACKENLYNLIDESKLKDELLSFKLDDLEAEKRTELWPILNRLLYGKMITKGAQKGLNPQTRKSLIMRFLAQCSQEEIQQFWQMSLGKYAEYCKQSLNIDDIPQLVQQQFDMQQVWSPKKLHSLINLLELLRKEFGGLMSSEFHACLLKLLIFVGAVSQHVLCKISANEMHPKMPVVFRNLRQLALQALYNFFAHLDNYEWNLKEIQTICQVYVWPYISKMPQESIHSPTVLLKLLLLWGEQPQYFEYLLLKPNHNDEMNDEKNIFFYIMELMLNEKAKPTVRRALMAMVERLLVAAQNLQDQPQLKDTALQLLRPFVADILKRLKMNFSQRRAKQQMDKRDLNILSLLTAHVEDAETCESLLQLLLPILIAKTQTQTSEELVCQVITTLSNLIARLENPESYLLKIAPLFEHVHEVAARKMLVNLLSDMAKKRHKQFKQQKISQTQAEEIKETARVILMLNAWDKRWVEQPDYDLRLQALKEVAEKLNNNNLQLELAVLIIYNCFYFIKYDKDMGLRDNAAEHLRLLLPKMTNKYLQENQQKLVDYLVGDIFMNIVKRLIKDSNENVRNESLKLLGTMVRECPVEAHNVLKDLKPLSDAQDLEVDFFENLTHLQSHRHGRALLKFCSLAENLRTAPQVTTLTQFILPLASRYLLEEKHAGKHTLIDAAIETLGIVCQLLPWTHYHSILKYYLMKMRTSQLHQKQAVRIVVRILDAFHFDLTNAQADAETLQKLKQQLLETEQQVAMQNEKLAETKKSEKTDDNNEDESEDDNEQQADNEEQQSLEQQLEEAADESDIETTNINSICILKQTLKLTPSASRRVMNTISTILIPTLNRCITEKSNYDTKHKLNRKRLSAEREEEEILRVPIALALVKLMQKLPKNVLDASLSGKLKIILKKIILN